VLCVSSSAFDTVGWVMGRTSSLYKQPVPLIAKHSLLKPLEKENRCGLLVNSFIGAIVGQMPFHDITTD